MLPSVAISSTERRYTTTTITRLRCGGYLFQMRRSVHCPVAVALLVALCAVLCFGQVYAATTGSSGREHNQATTPAKTKSLQEIENWRVYPVRSQDEAAVIEWGHSAIISALDAAVAYFGPQTAQAALLEVETTPVLADPVNGVWEDDENDAEGTTKHSKGVVRKLNNADEVHGNVVVMTDTGVGDSIISSGDGSGSGMNTLTGLDLALMAQASGAAALIVVHVDDERPDDTYRLQVPFVVPDVADDASFSVEYNKRRALEAAGIDIPVVVISLASANVLTTATVTAEMQQEDIVNNGMPDRIRLYAGGDRPFFEDVEAAEPTIYVIHNLLTVAECDALVRQAAPHVAPVVATVPDPLQLTVDPSPFVGTERVMLWQGSVMKGPAFKAVEERIEQVTGFPSAHYSDWTVDRLTKGSHWKPHYDVLPGNYVPLATITVFLSDTAPDTGGEIVFPSTTTDPVKIRPVKGMAVVHHNTNDQHEFEVNAVHALLPVTGTEDVYIARKFILPAPISNARRVALPVYAAATGGKLPDFVVQMHDYLTAQYGFETGGLYFDKAVVYLPMLLLLVLAQFIGLYVHKQMQKGSPAPKAKTTAAASSQAKATKPTASKKTKKRD